MRNPTNFLVLLALLASTKADITDTLETNDEFRGISTLAGPVFARLSLEGQYTVIAPTNEAIDALSASLSFNLTANDTILEEIVAYHIIPGLYVLANVSSAGTLVTLGGAVLNVNVVGSRIFLNNEVEILAEFPQDNGNIFAISAVVIPPSLRELFATTSCTDQACCDSLADPNNETGDGYLEFTARCSSGGLHCVGNTGCQLCHSSSVPENFFNRPICGGSETFPLSPCTSQACCTSRMNPNQDTGYGYLQYNANCSAGGLYCVEDSNCQNCFNSQSGADNDLNIPECSSEALASFGTGTQSQQRRDPQRLDYYDSDNSGASLVFAVTVIACALLLVE